MVDLDVINSEIERIESEELTFQSCSKLADLYVIRNNTKEVVKIKDNNSEFLKYCNQAPVSDILNIVDEHLECIKWLYPSEYRAIIEKIKTL